MRPEAKPVSIVICTYNRCDLLRKCIHSLFDLEYPKSSFEAVVVDDGSPEDIEPELKATCQEQGVSLNYIKHPQNRGLTAARNTGLAAAEHAVVAFLDDDSTVTPGWLSELMPAFDDPEVGGASGPNRTLPGINRTSEYCAYHRLHEEPKLVDGEVIHLIGANMALRREALVAVGGFDSSYSAAIKGIAPGGEESDISVMVRNLGYRLVYRPDAVTRHHQKVRAKAVVLEMFNFGVNRVLFRRKEGEPLRVRTESWNCLRALVALVAKTPIAAAQYRKSGTRLSRALFFALMDKLRNLAYSLGTLYGFVYHRSSHTA